MNGFFFLVMLLVGFYFYVKWLPLIFAVLFGDKGFLDLYSPPD